MVSPLRVASSQHDSHAFQTTAKIKVAQYRALLSTLTMLEQRPNMVFEQATSSYSFRFSELSQPI